MAFPFRSSAGATGKHPEASDRRCYALVSRFAASSTSESRCDSARVSHYYARFAHSSTNGPSTTGARSCNTLRDRAVVYDKRGNPARPAIGTRTPAQRDWVSLSHIARSLTVAPENGWRRDACIMWGSAKSHLFARTSRSASIILAS